MKIVTWNCRGAYRTKSDKIASYKPDIAVIQECERPDKLVFKDGVDPPSTKKWFGNLVNTRYPGISIMSYTGLEFSVYESYDPSIKYCIPLKVSGHINLNIIAVMGNIDDVCQAVNVYRKFIASGDTLIIGDFNSYQNRLKSNKKHTEVVNALREMNMVSAYHEMNKMAHGDETDHTYYMHYHEEKPSHIDYCFMPMSLVRKGPKIKIGDYDAWVRSKLSDHCPIFMELEL